MDEREAKTVFQVAYTEYGWAVSIGGRRVAVYPWQEEALTYVEERRAELRARGESSAVVIRGNLGSWEAPGLGGTLAPDTPALALRKTTSDYHARYSVRVPPLSGPSPS